MKVKMLTARVHADGHIDQFGDVVDLDRKEAERLIGAGQAWPFDERNELECATVAHEPIKRKVGRPRKGEMA